MSSEETSSTAVQSGKGKTLTMLHIFFNLISFDSFISAIDVYHIFYLKIKKKHFFLICKAQEYAGYALLFEFLSHWQKVIVWDIEQSFHRPDEFIPILRGAESWR